MAGTQMQLEDWLDDLCVRFIINLPEEDLSSVARLCFQVEEAQWFYEDFIRPLDPSLPSMSLRTFCLRIFQHCPLLASFSVENHTRAFEEFLQYKTRVPVRGAILLNQEMDSTVLVKGWKKSANWSFPRGKINKDEDDLDCAVREVWEETGLDLKAAGLVPTEAKPKYIEISMREQQMRLYVFRDVPMNTHFEPQTRKEISKIQWYKLSELPAFRKKGGQSNEADATTNANKFYMVAPFLVPLKKWVTSQKKIEAKRIAAAGNRHNLNPHFSVDEAPTEDDAWPQTMPIMPSHGPALDTLEGATNELQRLLKVQPPTQGLQPTTQEDKATALLSMLKIGGPSQLGQPPPLSQMPHTPLELNAGETPQPRNPHHHHNQHQVPFQNNQPPPAFNLHQHQYQQHQHPQGPHWNTPQQQQPFQGQIPARDLDGTSRQPPGHFPPPLEHPQPLPPQVQKSMYSQNIPQDQAPQGHPQHMPAQAQAAPKPPPGFVPPGPPNGAPQPLGTQSLALLNAFKRDTGNSPSTQPRQPAANQSGFPSDPIPSHNQQPPVPQIQHQASELAGSTTQNLPTHARKPSAQAPTDQHKSALLGMFKSSPAGASPQAQPPAQMAPPPQPGPPAGNANQQQLLGMFRRAPSGQEAAPQAMPNQGGPQQSMPQQVMPQQVAPHQPSPQTSNTGAALSDFLALKPNDQRVPSVSRSSGRGSANQRQPSAASNQSAQPVRILQRDRGADGMNFPSQPNMAPSHSPYSNPSQPANGSYASPPIGAARPEPGVPQQPQQQGAPQDQKRQLLSLFGNKPQASPTSVVPGAVEVGSDHGLPSRRESGTPMSPAEQTFLLDYLQSVTGGGKR